MNTLRRSRKQARLLPMLWLTLLLASGLVFSAGDAIGEEMATAETDSIYDAFFLLQYDFDLYKAKSEAMSEMDKIRFERMETFLTRQIDDERSRRYRGYLIIGISAVTAGVLMYLGGAMN